MKDLHSTLPQLHGTRGSPLRRTSKHLIHTLDRSECEDGKDHVSDNITPLGKRLRNSTIRRTTLAALFLALFFLISEGASNYFSSVLGDLLGIAVAALLVFFLAPLHRWAEWISSAVTNADIEGPEYATYQKFQMYRSAFEETLALGEIGSSQRTLLNRLRDSLNISEVDAKRLEKWNYTFTSTNLVHPLPGRICRKRRYWPKPANFTCEIKSPLSSSKRTEG